MDLGPHAFFIIASYAVTAVIVGALIARAVLDHRSQRRKLAELEERGLRRRSSDVPEGLSARDRPEGEAAASRLV